MNKLDKVFFHFELTTHAVAIGERIKGGNFRPCIKTIPTSALRGVFRFHFGLSDTLAIGFFRKGTYKPDIFTYASFDSFLGAAKIPISLEYLRPVNESIGIEADIYVLKDKAAEVLIKVAPVEISLGALKSKGFGRCELKYAGEIIPNLKAGYLKGRLLEDECSNLGIVKIIKQHQGYLFYPTSEVGGVYKRALFEGSIIKGPEFLIKEEYKYD